MAGILQPLIKSNVALLTQKIALIDLLVSRHGPKACEKFATVCPLVGASIGQHYRHSMDHVELAALLAANCNSSAANSNTSNDTTSLLGELHYDLRVRGGTLEKDIDMSRQRLVDVVDVFQSIQPQDSDLSDETTNHIAKSPITAYFNLSADTNAEIGLPSTIGRELGFAAHHAIHHMAMVKIIAVQTCGLEEGDLPHGFGRAPSTVVFDRNQG